MNFASFSTIPGNITIWFITRWGHTHKLFILPSRKLFLLMKSYLLHVRYEKQTDKFQPTGLFDFTVQKLSTENFLSVPAEYYQLQGVYFVTRSCSNIIKKIVSQLQGFVILKKNKYISRHQLRRTNWKTREKKESSALSRLNNSYLTLITMLQ